MPIFHIIQLELELEWRIESFRGGGMEERMEIHPIDRPMDGWTEQATKNLVMSALDGAFHQATERYSQRLMMK